MAWIDVPEPNSYPKRLLFKYDPELQMVQIRRSGITHNIDLIDLVARERTKQEREQKLEDKSRVA